MKKETVPVAVGAMILGFVLGIAFPKMFPDNAHQHAEVQQGAGAPSPQQPAEITSEQMEHALKYYKEMLKKDPKNKEIYVSMGNLCFDSEKYNEAIEYYQKALELDPNLTDVRVDMGVMYRRLGQTETAVKVIKEAIDRDPSHPVARLNLGIILKNDLKDYPLAINALEGFLKIAPDHPQAKMARQIIDKMESEMKAKGK